MIIVFFVLINCKESVYHFEKPTVIDIQKNIEKTKEHEVFLESELRVINNLEAGIKKAQTEKKPILLYFTGYAVVNARKIESDLLIKNQTVFRLMRDKYINVWLHVDDRKIGKMWLNYQKENFNTDLQPYFVILNSEGIPISKGMAYEDAKESLNIELLQNQ